MPNVIVNCDRCNASIDGFENDEATSGFYRSVEGGMWRKYMEPDEHIICDACMYKNARYITDYGVRG